MYNEHYYCVIMAGGIGSRFWPISREAKPKQFLDFVQIGKSFLRLTYDRVSRFIRKENIIVVSLTRYKDLVMQHLPELDERNLLLEPYNRNTASVLTFAAYTLLGRDPLAVMMATPADLAIDDSDEFARTMTKALDWAAGHDDLITIGITPTRPDSNFGYIQVSDGFSGDAPSKVKTFTEKPDVDLARVFIESGEFLWNSGMFAWRASAIRDELERYAPEITNLWKGWKEALDTPAQEEFLHKVYGDTLRISIDYAVMEKTDNAMVYPASFLWADIGNWDSLYEYLAHHDAKGNASNVEGKSLILDSHDNIIYSENRGKLTAIRGMDDYIVIDTDDVLLICPRGDEKFKDFLSQLAMPEFAEYK